MRIPPSHILPVFDDYKFVVCAKQTIHVVRARSDNNCTVISPAKDADTSVTKT